VPWILSTVEKYARDVKDKDVFRGSWYDKYLKKYIYLTPKKEFSGGKRKKKENRIDSFSIARNNGIAKFRKKNSHFTFIRVCRVTSSVKTSRDTLHRGSAHVEKK